MSRCFVIYTNEKRFYNPDGNETMNRRTILVQEEGTDNYYKIYVYKRFDWNPTLISSHIAPVKIDCEPYEDDDNLGYFKSNNTINRYTDRMININLLKNDMNRFPYKDNTMEIDQESGVSQEKYRELLRKRSEEREK